MPSDVEIAAAYPMQPIEDIAAKIGIPESEIFRYGPHKAKVSLPYVQGRDRREGSKLVLVTATSPTPAGEGKTTTTVGLVDGLAQIGESAAAALREPSMGPVFGMKGGSMPSALPCCRWLSSTAASRLCAAAMAAKSPVK